MKRFFCILSLVFILGMVSAVAKTEISVDSDSYNLGSEIASSVSLLADAKMQGKFTLFMICNNKPADFYSTDVSLEPGFRTSLNPRFKASEEIKGNCYLKGEFLDMENRIAEEAESAKFEITKNLNIELEDRAVLAKPGGKAQVKGIVKDASDKVLQNAAVETTLEGRKYFQNTDGGKFHILVDVPAAIKSGENEIEIKASDDQGNEGSSFFTVDVAPAHSSIKIISNGTAIPGKGAYFTIELTDQAGDPAIETIAVDLTDEKGNKIFRKHVQSNTPFGYEFSQYLRPGKYNLRAEFKGVEGEFLINLSGLRKIDVTYKDGYAFVENIGNVNYEDEAEFVLEGNESSRTIKKKVSLEPGESAKIYLLRNLPNGVYDIKFIEKIGNEGLYEQIEKILAKAEEIADKNSIIEKASLKNVASYVIGADGLLAKHPAIASAALIGIVLFLVFKYSKRSLARIFRRK